MTLVEIVDNCVDETVVVIGSLPPAGRDLDVLVTERSASSLEDCLPAAGFQRFGGRWIRLRGSRVDAIELFNSGSWELPTSVTVDVLRRATPLRGCRHVSAPDPVDTLLLLARRVAGSRRPPPSLLSRAAASYASAHDLWDEASSRARVWRLTVGLERLRNAAEGSRPTTWSWLQAQLEHFGWSRTALALVRRASTRSFGRIRRGPVFALSGIDGSGKSTQISAVAEILRVLDRPVAVVWSRVTFNPSLAVIAATVKLGLARWSSRGAVSTDRTSDTGPYRSGSTDDVRSRYPVVNASWAITVAMANAVSRRLAVAKARRGGTVVLTDRDTLDAVVELRSRYGTGAGSRIGESILRALSPRPRIAYFLDVSAAEAWRRKQDEHDPAALERHAMLYRSTYRRLGVRRIDGHEPTGVICERIARDVLTALDDSTC